MTALMRVMTSATLIVLAPATAMFSQGSQFSGIWESQSTPGLVWTVDHAQEIVKLVITMREREIRTITWVFGKPSTVPNAAAGLSAETTASIEDGMLVFDGKVASTDGQPAVMEETWKLNTAANELSVKTRVDFVATSFNREQVFRRRQ
jgi:hypothetical protein